MEKTLQTLLKQTPCLPVVVIDDVADAIPMAKALQAGGIKNVEITLRTAAALPAIEAILRNVPGMIVGAGTVFTAEQVAQAAKIGVSYIVSPGYSAALHEACTTHKLPYLPGAVTATEIQIAREKGLRILKFFPAEANGGVKTLKALAPVFLDMEFCATGGITFDNRAEYMALPNIIAVGMSAIVTATALQDKDWAGITANARRAATL